MTAEEAEAEAARIMDGIRWQVDVMTAQLPDDMDYGDFTRTDLVTVIMCSALDSLAGFLSRDDVAWQQLADDRDGRHASSTALHGLAVKLADTALD